MLLSASTGKWSVSSVCSSYDATNHCWNSLYRHSKYTQMRGVRTVVAGLIYRYQKVLIFGEWIWCWKGDLFAQVQACAVMQTKLSLKKQRYCQNAQAIGFKKASECNVLHFACIELHPSCIAHWLLHGLGVLFLLLFSVYRIKNISTCRPTQQSFFSPPKCIWHQYSVLWECFQR